MMRIGPAKVGIASASTATRKPDAKGDNSGEFMHALRELLGAKPATQPQAKGEKSPQPSHDQGDSKSSADGAQPQAEEATGQLATQPAASGDANPGAQPAAEPGTPQTSLAADKGAKPTPVISNDAEPGGKAKKNVSTSDDAANNESNCAVTPAPSPSGPPIPDAIASLMQAAAPSATQLPPTLAMPVDTRPAVAQQEHSPTIPARNSEPVASLPSALPAITQPAAQPGGLDAGKGARSAAGNADRVASPGVAQAFAAIAGPILALEAKWGPVKSNATNQPAGQSSDDASDGAAAVVGDDSVAPTGDVPMPDSLAKLVAAAVRQVTQAGNSDGRAPVAAPRVHHDALTDGGADGSSPAAVVRQESAPVPAFALPNVGPASSSNATPVVADQVDPGPRFVPEPKTPSSPTAHATLELDAAKTGASRIRIAVQGTQVRATITASELGALSLDRQLPELRRSLEDRGFSDIRLAVHAQEHAGAVATSSSASTDDARSFSRKGSDPQAQRSNQQDTGERAGSQRRRRDNEEEA